MTSQIGYLVCMTCSYQYIINEYILTIYRKYCCCVAIYLYDYVPIYSFCVKMQYLVLRLLPHLWLSAENPNMLGLSACRSPCVNNVEPRSRFRA